MIYSTPSTGDAELAVIGLIDDLQALLRGRVAEPRRWDGTLRRLTFARAVQGSNSIEGYNATLDDVVAAVEGEEPLDADAETRAALDGYRDALTYVLQLSHEPHLSIDESLVRSLHFMMLKHDLRKHPGRWRPGSIFIRREPDGEIVYEGPHADDVPGLMTETLRSLATDTSPVLVRAAMAHLNLVLVHPFSDGNGRMARCVQTLVLAKDRVVAPTFSSIEEYLGRNTQAYYDILAAVGQGAWHPENDARPWVRFCLTAHYRQARTLLRRIQESEELWDACTRLARQARVPERSVGALFDAALDFRLRNSSYRSSVASSVGTEISELTASRDLKALVDAGLLVARGEKRGRLYVGSETVKNERAAIRARRSKRDDDDPFALVGIDIGVSGARPRRRDRAPTSRRSPRGSARRP